MAVIRHELTLRSKGQRSRSWLSNALLTWVCMSVGLLRFSSYSSKYFITSFPRGLQSTVISMSVCLSLLAYLKNPTLELHQFLCMLPVVMARSSSGGAVIRYVLPVSWSWMTSCFNTVGPCCVLVYRVLRKRKSRN